MSTSQRDVFLSYAWGKDRHNQRRVQRLKTYLNRKYNISVWMDMNQITPGSSLSAEIERGLFGCKVFVLCITAEYANSENCIKELELAVALKKPILPILFEDLPWPIQGISFHLSSKIYASFNTLPPRGYFFTPVSSEIWGTIIQKLTIFGAFERFFWCLWYQRAKRRSYLC